VTGVQTCALPIFQKKRVLIGDCSLSPDVIAESAVTGCAEVAASPIAVLSPQAALH